MSGSSAYLRKIVASKVSVMFPSPKVPGSGICCYRVKEDMCPDLQAVMGTPCYMAPELFQEGGFHAYSSDLWAFGCLLYELATGRTPFASTSFQELVGLIMHAEYEPLPGLQSYSHEHSKLCMFSISKPNKGVLNVLDLKYTSNIHAWRI